MVEELVEGEAKPKSFKLVVVAAVYWTILALGLPTFLFIYFWFNDPFIERLELMRVHSEEMNLDAVMIRTDAGATTSWGHHIIITEPGWNRGYYAYRNYDASPGYEKGCKLTWRGNILTILKPKDGRDFQIETEVTVKAKRILVLYQSAIPTDQ